MKQPFPRFTRKLAVLCGFTGALAAFAGCKSESELDGESNAAQRGADSGARSSQQQADAGAGSTETWLEPDALSELASDASDGAEGEDSSDSDAATVCPGCSAEGTPEEAAAAPSPSTWDAAAAEATASGSDATASDARGGDSGVVHPGPAHTDSGAASETSFEGVCTGSAQACPEDVCPCADGLDAGGCDLHRPCDGWGDERDCNAEPGCTWELRPVSDEGLESGRQCQGTPSPCERPIGECLDGCEQVRRDTEFGSKLFCEGTPTECAAFERSLACREQVGCVWE